MRLIKDIGYVVLGILAVVIGIPMLPLFLIYLMGTLFRDAGKDILKAGKEWYETYKTKR